MKVLILTLVDNKPKIKRPGLKVDVVSWKSKTIETVNIRDYDGVIFDVNSLPDDTSELANFEIEVLSADALNDVLKNKDSFVAIIGDPSTYIHRSSLIRSLGFTLEGVNGSGDSLVKTDKVKGSKYEGYVNKIKTYDYSFKEGSAGITDDMAHVSHTSNSSSLYPHVSFNGFLVNRAGHIIAGTLVLLTYNNDDYGRPDNVTRFMEGRLLLVPVLPSGGRDSIESVLDVMIDGYADDNQAPAWSQDVVVVGQELLDSSIANHKKDINELTIEVDKLLERRSNTRQSIEILYKSDKPLEKSIKTYLENIGLTVTEPKADNQAEFFIEYGKYKFVTEVKSTKNKYFNQEGLRQVNDWRDDILAETGIEHKPILITSNQYSVEPSKRNDDFLDVNLISYAKKRGIGVISVKLLFETLQLVEKGQISLNVFVDSLYNTSGLFEPIIVEAISDDKKINKH